MFILLAQTLPNAPTDLSNDGILRWAVVAIGIVLLRVVYVQIGIMRSKANSDNEQRKQYIKSYDDCQERANELEDKLQSSQDELNVLHERFSQTQLEKQELQWKLDLCVQQMNIKFDENDEIITRKPQAPKT